METAEGVRVMRREVRHGARGRVRSAFTAEPGLDTARLAAELQRETGAEVRFDDGSRALYATDSSNYRQVPIGVVLPRSNEDVVRAMAVCRRYGVPVFPRGGGTALAGQVRRSPP